MIPRVVLDTNVIISALLFGGDPRMLLVSATNRRIHAITSEILLAELTDVLTKKFKFKEPTIALIQKKLRQSLTIVAPQAEINLLKDTPDNRVLEAAVEGSCNYIVTGDKELLTLKKYHQIIICTVKDAQTLLTR